MNKTVFAILALLLGCSKHGLSTGPLTCSYAGTPYHAGATFPATDGCNTCSCTSSGAVACTLMACLGDSGYSPPAERPKDAQPDTDGVARPRDAAKDLGPTCILPDGAPGQLDCYLCTCMDDGQASCLYVGCPSADANPLCSLAMTVTFGATGGMVTYEDQYTLNPTTGLTITRSYNGRGSSSVDGATVRSCTPRLPDCGSSSVVSVSTIAADLADPEVKAAFGLDTTPIYGVDQRPSDGSVWSIALLGAGSILVGAPCPAPELDWCRPIPAGVQRLATDLQSLAAAMILQAPCWGL
jgi:hypothetical protein